MPNPLRDPLKKMLNDCIELLNELSFSIECAPYCNSNLFRQVNTELGHLRTRWTFANEHNLPENYDDWPTPMQVLYKLTY